MLTTNIIIVQEATRPGRVGTDMAEYHHSDRFVVEVVFNGNPLYIYTCMYACMNRFVYAKVFSRAHLRITLTVLRTAHFTRVHGT